MLYGYDAYDKWLAWARSAQPLSVSATPIIHPGSAAAQLGATPEEMQEILADQEEWRREEEEQEERARGHTMAEETHQQQQGRDNTDAQTPPPSLEYTHDTVYDDDDVPFEHHNVDDGAVRAEPDRDAIEPLERELVFPEDTGVDWAEDLEEEMGSSIQGEYIHNNYPPAPSPASWYPPHPPV
jgi:hypothetical protein